VFVYKKFLVALAGVLGVLATVLADGSVSGDEAVSVGVAVVAAIGVYFAKNESPA
jgi:hypothetical protein